MYMLSRALLFLVSVKPHLSTADYQETEKIVQKFGYGVGKGLHEKLVQRSKTHKNWVRISSSRYRTGLTNPHLE